MGDSRVLHWKGMMESIFSMQGHFRLFSSKICTSKWSPRNLAHEVGRILQRYLF